MFRFKRTQKGFAPIETILIIVIVALIAFIAWYVFRTKSNTDSTLDLAGSSQISPPQKKQTSANSNTSTTSQIVNTKTDAKLGQYLADSKGKALYTYGADTTGVSNCTGSCLADWPVYEATSTTNLPANVTVITRADGTKQYAYKGMPLYYYTGDTSAGQVSGDGINNFHVAKP
jgi:predicted lipoprotein with Yx(FWY)xxD motif